MNVDLDPDLLPDLDCDRKMTESQIGLLDKTWNILQHLRWSTDTAVTFRDLDIPGPDLKDIIGAQWAAVYEKDPEEGENVHPQILRLLAFALEKIATKILSKREEPDRSAAKKQADEVIATLAKRRKRQ